MEFRCPAFVPGCTARRLLAAGSPLGFPTRPAGAQPVVKPPMTPDEPDDVGVAGVADAVTAGVVAGLGLAAATVPVVVAVLTPGTGAGVAATCGMLTGPPALGAVLQGTQQPQRDAQRGHHEPCQRPRLQCSTAGSEAWTRAWALCRGLA